jgi:PAS domain S-box-containing protein
LGFFGNDLAAFDHLDELGEMTAFQPNTMSTRLQVYGLALASVLVAAGTRFSLIPVLGNRFGFDLFLISTFVSGRYLGFGPSVFALLAGAVPVTLFHFTGPHLYDPYFVVGLIAYFTFGAIVVLLCKSEHEVRSALRQEIAERKAAEDIVRASEAQLREQEECIRLAVEAADLGTWDFNPITGEQQWSSRAKLMCGLLPDADVSNLSFRERVHPEDRERVNQAIKRAFDPSGDGVYEIEVRIVWPDNTVHWFIARGKVLFEREKANRRAARLIGTALDITQRKQAEEAIRVSEGRLQAMMDNTSAVIYLKDSHGRHLMVNRRFEELFNVTQRHIAGKTDADIFPPDVVAQLAINDRQVRETGLALQFEEVVPQADGPHTYLSVKFPVIDASGAVVATGGISTDISDRKAAENALSASEIRLRGILDHMPAVISLKDLEGRYVLVNRGFEDILGIRNHEIVGLTNYELVTKARSNEMSIDLADQFSKLDRKVIVTGEPVSFEDSFPTGDDPRLFATVKFPIKDASDKVTGVGGVAIDVTERRKAMDALAAEEEKLRHTVEFQDQERELLSYEIHDGLVQYATGALMQLEGIQHQLKSEADAAQVEQVVQILRRAVTEGRRLVYRIRTPVLDDWGAIAAIEQLIGETDQDKLEIQFIKDQALGRLSPRLEETLYRITQEALTNIRKHSQSTKVQIELARRGDRIHLNIRDWGIGFVPSKNSSGTNGLSGIKNRARIAGGQCVIESTPDEGTQILVDLPFVSRA